MKRVAELALRMVAHGIAVLAAATALTVSWMLACLVVLLVLFGDRDHLPGAALLVAAVVTAVGTWASAWAVQPAVDGWVRRLLDR